MAEILKKNKVMVGALIATLIIAGLTFDNLPSSDPNLGVQTISGVKYNFADYPYLNHEQIALYNYMRNIIMSEDVNSFDNWKAGNFGGLLNYMLAFTDYVLTSVFETTPGYRTNNYKEAAQRLIEKMNSSYIEQLEWGRTDYPYYTWPDADNSSGTSYLYTGGFRGPANIMWTGHFALMETYYERCFNTSEYKDEINWYMNDWNNSLTTDGNGTLKEGGIWGCGLIPCEPYIVFSQCNSIPIYLSWLYDNMYDTNYSVMWNNGLDFINNNMTEEYGLFVDGWFIQTPLDNYTGRFVENGTAARSPFITDGRASESSYCTSWTLTFLEYGQEQNTKRDYPIFLEKYRVDVSGDQMFMSGYFNNPGSFTDPWDILGTVFTCVLAKQRGDYNTVNRIQKWLNSPYNKVWSADGRQMHFDTSHLMSFLMPVLSGFAIWSTTPNTVKGLATPRDPSFWSTPYISQAEDDKIWVYQAQWDPAKDAFILNIKVDQTATLTFTNFNGTPKAYSNSRLLTALTDAGSNHTLTLSPGTYNIVILDEV